MKGKNTLRDKPFRYGGILKDYSKEIHELNRREYKCWCCGRDMKSHVLGIKIMPYTATFRITKGKDAVWNKDVTDKDERLDDGSTDIDSLDAFEYTIERDMKDLIEEVEDV